MIQPIISALFVTDENLQTVLRTLQDKNILPTPNNPSKNIEIGMVLVTRRINQIDLFDDRFGTMDENIWLCTRAEFDCMFVFIEDENRTENFGLIKLKK